LFPNEAADPEDQATYIGATQLGVLLCVLYCI
jgi:hypothetical protein